MDKHIKQPPSIPVVDQNRIEDAIVKVYLLKREELRARAHHLQELAPEDGIPL